MKKFKTLEGLIMFLLYCPNSGGICVGIIGDIDISDNLEPKFRKRIEKLVNNKYSDKRYK